MTLEGILPFPPALNLNGIEATVRYSSTLRNISKYLREIIDVQDLDVGLIFFVRQSLSLIGVLAFKFYLQAFPTHAHRDISS